MAVPKGAYSSGAGDMHLAKVIIVIIVIRIIVIIIIVVIAIIVIIVIAVIKIVIVMRLTDWLLLDCCLKVHPDYGPCTQQMEP